MSLKLIYAARVAALMLVLILVATAVHAEEKPRDYFVSTVTSYHFNRDRDYNEKNFGLGVERRFNDTWALSAGVYENSFNRTSAYIFGAYTPWEFMGWRTGFLYGAVTGYDYSTTCRPLPDGRTECREETRPSAWATGVATRDFGRFGVNVVMAPTALALQVKWRLDGPRSSR